ncbi:hypothetical protein BKA56DRAFT_58938 [Ilyonectria sp. MPI-CAGE-AT-0026]|nr:hypothetical protein BKA56DRAFT_58938 [Ilyonectria sp. MPI-CAGE-AT-0026]
MSQVRNLRAMFENKGDTSPPDRGRSSGASTPTPTPGANGTESPRPLSKVRTNFVAIEKDGRIGLRRDPSHESTVSRQSLSMDTDADSTTSGPDRPVVTADEVPRATKLFVQETIPESPRQPPDTKTAAEDDASVFDKRSVSPAKDAGSLFGKRSASPVKEAGAVSDKRNPTQPSRSTR